MRIVQIEDFFHPDAGYQINILSKEWSRQGHEVYIITANPKHLPPNLLQFFDFDEINEKDKLYQNKYNVKILRVDTICRISNRIIFKKNIFKLVKSLNPSILYVHGNDTYIGILASLKMNKFDFPLILDTHMVDMASNNKLNKLFYFFYRKFITPILKKKNTYIIRTADVNYIFDKFDYPQNLSPNLGFGSDISVFHPNNNIKSIKRKEMGIPADSFVFIYAGKLDETKGGLFLSNCLLKKIETNKDLTFVIIGNCNSSKCDEIESNFSMSENRLIRLSTQTYESLGDLFRIGDVAIFPKQCSLTYYDMQASALPVILEDNEVNKSRINMENGILFETNDMESFRKSIIKYANMGDDEFIKHSNNSLNHIIQKYDYSKIAKKYLEYIEISIEKFKKGRKK